MRYCEWHFQPKSLDGEPELDTSPYTYMEEDVDIATLDRNFKFRVQGCLYA